MCGVQLDTPGTFVTSLDNANMGTKDSTVNVCMGTKEDVNNVHGTTVEEPNATKKYFATMFKKPTAPKAVNLTQMISDKVVQGENVAIPLAVVEEISKRFDNTLYGYFIGKRLAFLVVENYVKNTWVKFRLKHVMLTNGFFFFQFATREDTYLVCMIFKVVEDIEVSDVNSTGLRYTWNQNPSGDDGIIKKIDRIMANMEFLASFVGASALFQLVHNVRFKKIVANGWQDSVSRFWMFKVVKHPKFLKKPLRKLLYDHGNIYENVKKLRHELDDEAQKALDSDPNNVELQEEDDAYLQAFNDALLMEERFLMQKEKVEWLKLGDANTAYFHKVVKSQASRNQIDSVTTSNGVCVDGDQVPLAFIDHYTDFLGQQIISNRMKESLNSLVSLNQSAFVPGRRIADNILLTQELMHNYHLDRSNPRCSFKVDIQKAYDTVDCKFLKDILIGFGFHPRMIGWIMECVTSTSFSLSINGSLHGYFKGKRELRQAYTINLCFADDLFLFTHGDVDSARVIMNTLEEFKNASGLTPSLPKSMAYFCNVLNLVKLDILRILPFEEGKLPVKYLRVPLVPSRLLYQDCMELMKKSWPIDWVLKHHMLANLNVPNLSNASDGIVWRHSSSCHSPLIGYETQAQDSRYVEAVGLAKTRSARSVVAKLVFAASSYFIWQERNNRLFMKTTRTWDQVINIIKSTVRLKLLTCKFKKTKNVQMIIHLWKLPTSLIRSFPH
nr:hypothetical protein [Tanacetum cinerariifolium]